MTALLGREVTVTSAAIVLGSLLAVGCAALPGAEAQYRVEEAVSYKQVDGQSLTGDLYLPKKTGIKPAVLVVHGGGWRNRSGEMGGISKRLANDFDDRSIAKFLGKSFKEASFLGIVATLNAKTTRFAHLARTRTV